MSSPSAVVCREIFDENSQPSADEISEYAHQLGIDPDSESHLLPLAREGLMQALPSPWKAYFDEKLQTHYYYNEETKSTQWEHPLDNVYRELVKRARDASVHDDTCASVQELPTSEDNTKNLERVETRVESDDDELSTDSEQRPSETKGRATRPLASLNPLNALNPLSSIPPIAPLSRKLAELRISPLRRSIDTPLSPKPLVRPSERPRTLPKQHSEVIDLKMHVLSSPEEEVFSPLLSNAKIERGLPFSGKGNMFLKLSKSDLPSPDTEKSLPDSLTKSDPPKGILREKSDSSIRRNENVLSRPKQTASFEEDRKSVRFKLEGSLEPALSPGSNSSSEPNEGQSSVVSAPPAPAPLAARPPLPPRPPDKDHEGEEKGREKSPRRRLIRPPASDYIKPELFQKNFQKISELVRRQDSDSAPPSPQEPVLDTEPRPRSPMIPQKNKISINLMESIESETSLDSPDREFANLDLNDLDESNESHDSQQREEAQETKSTKETSPTKEIEEAEITNSKVPEAAKPRIVELPIPQIKIPKLDFLSKQKFTHSDSEDSKKSSNMEDEISHAKTSTRSNSIDIPKDNRNLIKLSPTPSLGDRSPKFDFAKTWSTPLSTFKPLNKIGIPNKSSESVIKGTTSPRLDGVIISQGKTNSDNVVVVYQFETQEESPKPIKSPLIPDMGTREFMERNRNDEKRRLELSLQKELELIRMEWAAKEKKMRAELQEEIAEAEQRFLTEKRMRLNEQVERHKKEMEETLSESEGRHQGALQKALADMAADFEAEARQAERRHAEALARLKDACADAFADERERLEIENERALAEVREQLQTELSSERARMVEANRLTIEALREEHTNRITDLRLDYRAEVEGLRRQQAAHVAEVRARLLGERAAALRAPPDPALPDKYRCLKEKYARLKHDVKMSIERRNKRREMSMTTGSETEKSNSHKATHSLEKCKEVNETSISVVLEEDPTRLKPNNNLPAKGIDNEASASEGNAHKLDNNNDEWKAKSNTFPSVLGERGERGGGGGRGGRRAAVAFRDFPRTPPSLHRGAATDYQDSSDATTADERPKEAINGHGRRRCFTRLKSASTSRLNYSPKRGEGWGGPLEALRVQLRKLDELEEQCPDLACQPPYALPYPFADLEAVRGSGGGGGAAPELEFVRHRALVEREGMRRARAVLRRRRKALRDAPAEEREATELEVALHRARALLGEKEIRLRHIERALRALPDPRPPEPQEAWSSSASSEEEALGGGAGGAERSGAVLRSLRALHKDVRHIWRAVHAAGQSAASPETSSCNVPSTSQTKMTLSGGEPSVNEVSDGVAERARGLRAWLHTAP